MKVTWTDVEKENFQKSLKILKETIGDQFLASAHINLNILDEYLKFKQFATANHELEEENPNLTDFFYRVRQWAYTIFSVYYLQNFNTENSYNKSWELFNEEKKVIINLSGIAEDLDNFLEQTSTNVENDDDYDDEHSTRRKRRWQTHPINQLREEKGFYDNLVVELKQYRKYLI